MKLIYGGPIDEVEVPDAGIVAARGEPVEIPEDVAVRLLEQETWREAERGLDYSVNSDDTTTTPPTRKGGKG